MGKTFWHIHAFILYSIVLLSACTSASDKGFIAKPKDPPTDSLTKWLSNSKNIQDSTYMQVFFKHFNGQVERKLYDSAAESILAWNRARLNPYDSVFLHTSLRFWDTYATKLSKRYYAYLAFVIGKSYEPAGKADSAKYWYNKVLALEETEYHPIRAKAMVNDALTYMYAYSYNTDSALQYAQTTYSLYERLRDTSGLAKALNARNAVFGTVNAFAESQKAMEEAVKLAAAARDTSNLLTLYFNQWNLQHIERHSIQVLPQQNTDYAQKLSDLHEAWKKPSPYHDFMANYVKAYELLEAGKWQEAAQYRAVLEQITKAAGQPVFTHLYGVIERLYDLKSSASVDMAPYLAQVEAAKQQGDYHELFHLYEALSAFADKQEDHKAALEYTLNKYVYRDSLWNQHLRGTIFELETKYETRLKEQQIQLQKSELRNKNNLIFGLVMGLALLVMGGILVYTRQQKRHIQQEAAMQADFTTLLFSNVEEERERIARDLHDGLSHELLSLRRDTSDTMSRQGKIDQIIDGVRQISRNLHPVMLNTIGLKLSVEELCNLYESEQLFLSHELSYTHPLDGNTNLQLFRIIQESLMNVIKYAEAEAAKISISEKEGNLYVEIKDNGKGFDVEKTLNGGKAFGLLSIRHRVTSLGGKLNISSSPKGTTLDFSIPLSK